MLLNSTISAAIEKSAGIQIRGSERVHGGDINECWRLHTAEGACFLKLNDLDLFPAMFQREAEGLKALADTAQITVPGVLHHGTAGKHQFLLLEWMEKGSPRSDSLLAFGRSLAHLHLQQQASFGWQTGNYIGSLQQHNTVCNTWEEFYTSQRIMPLVVQLCERQGTQPGLYASAERFCKQAASLFPKEPPSLLHGDLWGGNYMIGRQGHAIIFDPAVYAGHREMDIGMSRLFGGFPIDFYEGYNDVYPLEKGWTGRLPLSQLYPLLVHALLFGGHYISAALEIIKAYS